MRIRLLDTARIKEAGLEPSEVDIGGLKIAGFILENAEGNLVNLFCWKGERDFEIVSPGDKCTHTLSDLVARIRAAV